MALVIRRGDVFVARFFKDKACPGVVVRSDVWRKSDNVTMCQLTESAEQFNLARTRVQVRNREGTARWKWLCRWIGCRPCQCTASASTWII